MKVSWFGSALCILFLTTALQGQSRESLLKTLGESPDWKPVDAPAEFDETNIDQVAGRLAIPITRYGFAGATSQNWAGPQGSVRLTMYEMADSSAAFAIFSRERDSSRRGYTPLPVGTEGFRQANRSWFWQARYVICLDGETQSTESLARLVSQNILGRSVKPPVSNLLPPLHLVQGSDRYLLFPEDLDPELALEPAAAGFDDSVEVATATYRVDNKSARLVLLLYPTQQIAKKYADQWDAAEADTGTFRKRVGAIVALVRGTRDEALAQEILGPVNYETQVTWNEPPRDITLSQLLITILTFTGISMVFLVIAGISFGGLRIFVKARYPNRIFDRAQDIEIIQLQLPKGVTRREISE